MRKVNFTDFKTHFDEFADLARDEPIEVLRGSKRVGVVWKRPAGSHELWQWKQTVNGLAMRRPYAP